MLELSKPIKGRKLYPLNHLISSSNIVAFVKWTLGLFWLHGVLKKVLHGVLMGSFKKILEVAGTLLPLIMRGAARHYYITWKHSGDFLIPWTFIRGVCIGSQVTDWVKGMGVCLFWLDQQCGSVCQEFIITSVINLFRKCSFHCSTGFFGSWT